MSDRDKTDRDNIGADKNNLREMLRLQEAKKRDIGRNIVRIDQKTMDKLKIETGAYIGLFGKKESAVHY